MAIMQGQGKMGCDGDKSGKEKGHVEGHGPTDRCPDDPAQVPVLRNDKKKDNYGYTKEIHGRMY
jgi:hypothetical protein